LAVFEKEFGHYEMSMISSDDIMNFLVTVTEGHKSSTKKLKYSLLKTFGKVFGLVFTEYGFFAGFLGP